jgi:uncharacterized coiled-coil protein SlyX
LYDILKEDVKNIEVEILNTLEVTNSFNKNINEPPHTRIAEHNIKIDKLIETMNNLYEKVKKASL